MGTALRVGFKAAARGLFRICCFAQNSDFFFFPFEPPLSACWFLWCNSLKDKQTKTQPDFSNCIITQLMETAFLCHCSQTMELLSRDAQTQFWSRKPPDKMVLAQHSGWIGNCGWQGVPWAEPGTVKWSPLVSSLASPWDPVIPLPDGGAH